MRPLSHAPWPPSCSQGWPVIQLHERALIGKGHGNPPHLPFLSSKAKSSPGVFDSWVLIMMAAISGPVG